MAGTDGNFTQKKAADYIFSSTWTLINLIDEESYPNIMSYSLVTRKHSGSVALLEKIQVLKFFHFTNQSVWFLEALRAIR